MNPQQSVGRIGFFGAQLENLYCISQINTLSLWNIAEGETLASFPSIRADLSAHMPTDYLLDCHWDAASSSLFLASGDLRYALFSVSERQRDCVTVRLSFVFHNQNFKCLLVKYFICLPDVFPSTCLTVIILAQWPLAVVATLAGGRTTGACAWRCARGHDSRSVLVERGMRTHWNESIECEVDSCAYNHHHLLASQILRTSHHTTRPPESVHVR